MDLLERKITTFGYITSKPHLTVQEKLTLLNFVKEASKLQLDYLLKKGRMLTESEILKEAGEEDFEKAKEEVKDEPPPAKDRDPAGMTAAERKQAADDALQRAHKRAADKGLERAKGRESTRKAEEGQAKAMEKGKPGEEGSDQPAKVDQEEPQAEETKGEEDAMSKKELAGDKQSAAPGTIETLKGRAKELQGDVERSETYQKGKEIAGQVGAAAETGKEKAKDILYGKRETTPAGEESGQRPEGGGVVGYAQQNPGEAAAYTAAAAGAITAGVLAYKRFFSKAARACSGLSGGQKTTCMSKYKVQAKKAEIATLNAKKAACKGNPKCIAKVGQRIAKANSELQGLGSGG